MRHEFLGQVALTAAAWLIASCTAIGMFLPPSAKAQTGGYLRDFQGTWNGAGTLSHQDGVSERIRCQAFYAPLDARRLQQRLRCTSDSTSFDLVSNLTEDSGRLTGDWTEIGRNARGNLVGRIGRGNISANVQGPGFTAAIVVAARGNRQSVNIRSEGGDITAISMTLSR
jgi:hypothetical protein